MINNQGGGIFEHLPQARSSPEFEAVFATPQAVDLGQLCAAHGIAHECIDDWQQARERIAGQRLPACACWSSVQTAKPMCGRYNNCLPVMQLTDTDLGLIRKYNRPDRATPAIRRPTTFASIRILRPCSSRCLRGMHRCHCISTCRFVRHCAGFADAIRSPHWTAGRRATTSTCWSWNWSCLRPICQRDGRRYKSILAGGRRIFSAPGKLTAWRP